MKWEDIPEDKWEDVAGAGDPMGTPKMKEFGKNFVGGNDAALSMLAQLPAMAAGGLGGLGTLMSGQGIDKSVDTMQRIQESNFGLGAPKPFTEAGKQVTEMVTGLTDKAKEEAGMANYRAGGGEAGRAMSEFSTDMILNFLPIPGAKGVRKASKAIESKLAEPKVKPIPESAWTDIKATAKAEPGDFYIKEHKPTPAEAQLAQTHDSFIQRNLEAIDKNILADYDPAIAAKLSDQGVMEKLQRADEAATNLERGEVVRSSDDPIYVDPQGQAFKGDPKEADARLALEKQMEAMDRELTHLRGKDTPEGEPLRPLQDHELNQRRVEAEQQRIKLEEIENNLNKLLEERGIRQISPGGKQTGAVNPRMFEDMLLASKRVGNYTLELFGRSHGPEVVIKDAAGNEIGNLGTSAKWRKNDQNLEVDFVKVQPQHRGQQLAKEAYRMLAEQGNDIHKSSALLSDGRKMWNKFEQEGLAKNGMIRHIPIKQRGAVGRDLSPKAQAAHKQELLAKQFKRNLGLDEWDTLRDKEVAKELAATAKDLSVDLKQRNLVSGLNMEVALSNNPLLKFARTVLRDGRTAADQFSRKFITDPKTGLTPLWTKMKPEQRVEVMKALMEADKRQVELTPEFMDRLGFDSKMKQFAMTFRSADESLLAMQNKMAAELGLKPTDRRTGHFPGVFVGSYKTLAVVGEGKAKQVVAVLATDTKAQQKLAMEYIKKNHPEVKFVEQGRAGLSMFSDNKYYSDIFSGWQTVMELLGREDTRFSQVQEIVDKALLDANNTLFNFNVHELSKKGVIGNEGNKPWLDAKQNANEAFHALVRYFEEGALHHTMQKPLKDVKDLLTAPETDHMPRARKYMLDYLNKVHQRDVNDIGKAINTILDEPFKYIPTVSWDKNGNIKTGVGVGPGEVLKIAGVLKNNMSQLYMGWMNAAFTLAQFAQPVQTGLPFMQMAASRIGASPDKVVTSLGKGFTQFMGAFTEKVGGKKIDMIDPIQREAFQYAVDRGLFEFSEIEKAYQGTQGPLSRAKDRLAEANMKLGEQATRTPMFMSFVDLLIGEGMDKMKAFEIAENLTQGAMIDYHQWERPMLYSKLGVMGGFAAGLTTFKHGYMSQQAYLTKQAVKPAAGKRSEAALPLVYSVAAMLALGGVTGLPFYTELDAMYRGITNTFMDEAKSIRETVLAGMPEWVNSGVISAATNMNWQSKFSSSDMIPDNMAKAVSPHLEGAYRIGKAGVDMITEQDAQSVRNFATAATPSGWRGVTEEALAKDEQGNLIGKDGLPSIHRSEKEWEIRKYTGLRSQREALEREGTWDARLKQKADTDRRKEIHTEYQRRLVNDNLDADSQQKLEEEYMNRKGDVRELLELWKKVELEKQKTEKERLEGTPNSLSGYTRWEYFNK